LLVLTSPVRALPTHLSRQQDWLPALLSEQERATSSTLKIVNVNQVGAARSAVTASRPSCVLVLTRCAVLGAALTRSPVAPAGPHS
jgi:hypothetical protein